MKLTTFITSEILRKDIDEPQDEDVRLAGTEIYALREDSKYKANLQIYIDSFFRGRNVSKRFRKNQMIYIAQYLGIDEAFNGDGANDDI